MKLILTIQTIDPDYDPACLNACVGTRIHLVSGAQGHLPALQRSYELASEADIIGFLHTDVAIHEDEWEQRVLACFEDEDVVVVGFGGALAHGHPDIYKVPYELVQLARYDYLSNQTDAERHGGRETGVREVAVLDSFAVFVRRSFLDDLGGWPVTRYAPSHCMDYWISMKAHERGKRVLLVGVSCTHPGGGKGNAANAVYASLGTTDEEAHALNHRTFYEEARGVLPVRK